MQFETEKGLGKFPPVSLGGSFVENTFELGAWGTQPLQTGQAHRTGNTSIRPSPVANGPDFPDSRRAEVIALFLSEVLIMHVLGFHQFKTGRNFRLSFSKNSRHVIYLGVTCLKSRLDVTKCLSELKISTSGSLRRMGDFRSSGFVLSFNATTRRSFRIHRYDFHTVSETRLRMKLQAHSLFNCLSRRICTARMNRHKVDLFPGKCTCAERSPSRARIRETATLSAIKPMPTSSMQAAREQVQRNSQNRTLKPTLAP